jgi:delta-aminolevulinic acid dehydratase/porphobilinogen synthase
LRLRWQGWGEKGLAAQHASKTPSEAQGWAELEIWLWTQPIDRKTLFPNTQADRRSDDGAEALNPDNLMCRAIRAIKQAHGDAIGILTDVALDPYTSHGQDGLIDEGLCPQR